MSKPRLVKLKGRQVYYTFILETAATLKELKLASVIMPQRSASAAQAFCLSDLKFIFHNVFL